MQTKFGVDQGAVFSKSNQKVHSKCKQRKSKKQIKFLFSILKFIKTYLYKRIIGNRPEWPYGDTVRPSSGQSLQH